MRIHKTAVLGDRADTVCVAIGGETGMAAFLHHRFLQHCDVRFDRLGVDSWEQRIELLTNGDVLDVAFRENSGQHPSP